MSRDVPGHPGMSRDIPGLSQVFSPSTWDNLGLDLGQPETPETFLKNLGLAETTWDFK